MRLEQRFIALAALIGACQAANDTTSACSASNPCTEGCCSSTSEVCGYGPDYCASDVCIADASTNGTCSQLSDCDPGVYPGWGTVWGSEYAASEYCPLNVCCSEFGFCGTTTDFCGTNTTVTEPSCSSSTAPLSRRVGYWEAWNSERPCDTMDPEDIPVAAYTHLILSFMYIDPDSYDLVPMASNQTQYYSRFTALKEDSDVETWFSIGGWAFNDVGSTEETFSNLVASTTAQETFFASVIAFLEEYGFDGVDIDWEYPGSSDRGGNSADTANFVTFLDSFRSALDAAGDYGLSITIPSSYWYMQWFDIVDIDPYIDWFNVMTYDIYGTWDAEVDDIGSNVYADTNLTMIESAFDLLWRNNISASKVNMGFGFYGRGYTLEDPTCTAPGCPFSSGSLAGACTQTEGYLSYDEILSVLDGDNVTVTLDETAAVKIAVWDTDQWIGYDDPETILLKLEYANSRCIGGAMVWAVDTDLSGTLSEALSNITNVFVGSSNSTGEIFVAPDIWTSSAPSIGCEAPCTFVLPPYPLESTHTVTWPTYTTSLLSSSDGSVYTKTTSFSVAPFAITGVPVWPITVDGNSTASAEVEVKQSVIPPSWHVTLPGTEVPFPISSIDYTAIAITQESGTANATATATATVVAATTTEEIVSTPAAVQTGIVSDCIQFYEAVSGDTCAGIASTYGISLSDFYAWNPAVGTDCSGLWAEEYYCVAIGSNATATSTSTGSSNTTTSITPPTPKTTIQTTDCTEFYLVESGDGCAGIEETYSISFATFLAWNPSIGSDCTNLEVGYYYCVSNSSTTSSSSSSSTSTGSVGNGTTTATFYSTSHVITILLQPTHTSVSVDMPSVAFVTGVATPEGDCSVDGGSSDCGTLDCGLFGCDGECGTFGCDGGCGLGWCGGGCGLGGCGPGCGDGDCIIEGGGGGEDASDDDDY